MRRKALAEIVAQYIDSVNQAADKAVVSIATLAEDRRELEALIPVIHRLRETLMPVEPSPYFKDALEAKLVAAWHEQRRKAATQGTPQRREIFLRAAAVGSFVSVAALIAVVARSRMRHAHIQAN